MFLFVFERNTNIRKQILKIKLHLFNRKMRRSATVERGHHFEKHHQEGLTHEFQRLFWKRDKFLTWQKAFMHRVTRSILS